MAAFSRRAVYLKQQRRLHTLGYNRTEIKGYTEPSSRTSSTQKEKAEGRKKALCDLCWCHKTKLPFIIPEKKKERETRWLFRLSLI